jgi:simple sugar transport system ATP-binding protein
MPTFTSLTMQGITKRCPGVVANDNVSFDVQAGEIHALLGENGAGKSTLMKILYGLYQPDEGEILLNDQPVKIHSPNDSISLGIGMIHQHFMLVDNLTVAENVALGLPGKGIALDLAEVEQKIRVLGERYRLNVAPTAIVGELAVGQQQRVEIIKALYRGAALLVLDEPTAVLTPQEADDLFVILRQMAAEGHGLIFISHKLREILALTDRVTVLRAGKLIGTRPTAGATRADLARMMVGREVTLEPPPRTSTIGAARLKVEQLSATDGAGASLLREISFTLHAGEVLGIAGVSGNGQRPLAEAVTGLRPLSGGVITLNGQDITHLGPSGRIRAGIAYVPEERMHDGVVKDFSVAENTILRTYNRRPAANGIFLDFTRIFTRAVEMVKSFAVKTPTIQTPIKNLSGGNIQKLILARELAEAPVVLIAAQPTRGVDIGASEAIHQRLLMQRDSGTAVLLISEDLDEIFALADRIAVMFAGRLVGILPRASATAEQVGLLMAGEAMEEPALA